MAKKFSQVFKIKHRIGNDPIQIDSILGEAKADKEEPKTVEEEAPKKKGGKKAKVVEEKPQTEEIIEVNE